ncbi:hypothetical protein BKA64DRAFT_773154 [Cadophora sp. MPI-SDFR-AT-0126]|nr:hypothetical protein BKA64DRAFT_773154 [Leotiomycetes sp. MPI-SDFR-AT-0126]
MKATLVLLPALAAICHGAALPHDADIFARDEGWNQWKRQVTVVVTKTTTKTTAPAVYTTSTKYTTLPTPVITKTSTVTKPYTTPKEEASTVIVTVTGKPVTVTPSVVTVTVTAKTSSSAKPPVTVTVTVAPPEETEEPEEPSTTDNSWQITRTLPPLTFGKRDASPVPEPEAEPQRGRPTRWGNWGPGGQTIVQTQTVKETVTYYPPTSTGITKTITITPTLTTSLSTSVTTIYYTPPPSTSKELTTITKTATVIPTITAGPITVTKTLTPTPTPKSTVKSTITIWDGAIKGKRSPQTLGFPSRTANTLPTETEYPDPEEEDPEEEEEPEYPDDEPTFVLGTPTRTVRVSPTPIKPTSTKKPTRPTYIFPPPSPTNEFSLGTPTRTVNVSPTPPKATSTKKPWWYSPPKTVTITEYLSPKPTPTGTLIVNSGTLPVLTLGGKRADTAAAARGKRQGADADVTRSATFAPGAPVKSIPGFVTSTKKP